MAFGVGLGYGFGGRVQHLSEIRLRGMPLVLSALGGQAALAYAPNAWRAPAVLFTYGLVGAWFAVNHPRRTAAFRIALGLLAAGWSMNLSALLARGQMPVSEIALARAGAPSTFDAAAGNLSKHIGVGTEAAGQLGDVIPVPALSAVISIGDVLLAVGITAMTAVGMTCSRSDA